MVLTGKADFASRVKTAQTYFERVREMLGGSWADAHSRYQATRDVVDGLVLIHPMWLDGNDLPDPRGPRAFHFSPSGEVCQSPLIWGYHCPGSAMEIDHMFPYGLGGPTRPENGLILCREHNRLKGHDIHLLPWETYGFPWLAEQIERVTVRVV